MRGCVSGMFFRASNPALVQGCALIFSCVRPFDKLVCRRCVSWRRLISLLRTTSLLHINSIFALQVAVLNRICNQIVLWVLFCVKGEDLCPSLSYCTRLSNCCDWCREEASFVERFSCVKSHIGSWLAGFEISQSTHGMGASGDLVVNV